MSCTETIYIQSATSLSDRLTRITAIIEALELRVIDDAASTANIEEYEINDGQTKIRTVYTSVESIWKAIESFEKLKQKLLNQLNGRGMALRPWQGLR